MPATSPLLNMPLRTPAEALAASLTAAHRRFAIHGRVVHMDGVQRGTLRDIQVEDGAVRLIIITDDNRALSEMPGYWSRSSL